MLIADVLLLFFLVVNFPNNYDVNGSLIFNKKLKSCRIRVCVDIFSVAALADNGEYVYCVV